MLCTYCVENEFAAPSRSLLLDHIRLVHSQDPDFTIQCPHSGCSQTFHNFRTYQNHQLTHVQSSSEAEVEEPDEVTASSDGHNVSDVPIDSEIRTEEAEVCRASDDFGSDHIRQYAAK